MDANNIEEVNKFNKLDMNTELDNYMHYLNYVVNGEPRKKYLSEMRKSQKKLDNLYLWVNGCDDSSDSNPPGFSYHDF